MARPVCNQQAVVAQWLRDCGTGSLPTGPAPPTGPAQRSAAPLLPSAPSSPSSQSPQVPLESREPDLPSWHILAPSPQPWDPVAERGAGLPRRSDLRHVRSWMWQGSSGPGSHSPVLRARLLAGWVTKSRSPQDRPRRLFFSGRCCLAPTRPGRRRWGKLICLECKCTAWT